MYVHQRRRSKEGGEAKGGKRGEEKRREDKGREGRGVDEERRRLKCRER